MIQKVMEKIGIYNLSFTIPTPPNSVEKAVINHHSSLVHMISKKSHPLCTKKYSFEHFFVEGERNSIIYRISNDL